MMTNQPDDLLDQLFTATAPYVDAAAAAQPAAPTMRTLRIFPSPFRVEVAHHHQNGRTWIFPAPGDPALAELTAHFLTEGVAALPETQRRASRALLSRGEIPLVVLMDLDQGTAGAAFLPSGNTEPVLLFVLHRPPMVH